MPTWINIRDSIPTEKGKYFVKIFKRKEILDLDRLEQYYDQNLSDVYWLNENIDIGKDVYQPKQMIVNINKQQEVLESIVKDKYSLTSVESLQRIFGVNAGSKLYKNLLNKK